MTVLVANASGGVALAVIRSLGKKGIKVTGAAPRNAYPMYSKYCKDKIIYGTYNNRRDITGRLLQIVKENNYDVFLPVVDEKTLILLSRNKEKFEKYTKLPIADPEILETASDKAKVMEIAEELGIPCPKTYPLTKISDIEKLKNKIEYPVVIKPRHSRGSRGVVYVNSKYELVRKFRKVYSSYKKIILQEYIPHGGAYGFETLFDAKSKPKAIFVHKRLREYPIHGGPSTLRESVKNTDAIRLGLKILKKINWYGVCMVEFRKDPRDNKLKVMEINPRFWGSLPLSIAAGVDFPYLLYKMAINEKINSVFEYRAGIKCRWLLFGDIKHFIEVMRKGNSNQKQKFKTIIEFFKFHDKDLYYDIISLDDPKPAIYKVVMKLLRV